MGDLLDSVKLSDLVQGVNTGGETSVKAEDLAFHHCSEGEVVEELGELLPDVGISVLPQTLIVEPITRAMVIRMWFVTLG